MQPPQMVPTGDAVVPWPTATLWNEARETLQFNLSQALDRMAVARQIADRLAHQLDLLADRFDQLAATTCDNCPDPCCAHAKVWLNFQDLLFIHLHKEILPPHQLRRNFDELCRFLGLRGCTLPPLDLHVVYLSNTASGPGAGCARRDGTNCRNSGTGEIPAGGNGRALPHRTGADGNRLTYPPRSLLSWHPNIS